MPEAMFDAAAEYRLYSHQPQGDAVKLLDGNGEQLITAAEQTREVAADKRLSTRMKLSRKYHLFTETRMRTPELCGIRLSKATPS